MKALEETQGRRRGGRPAWQQACGRNLRSLRAVEDYFSGQWQGRSLSPVARRYPLAVTRYYTGLVERPDPADPIFRQCIPAAEELENSAELTPDPLAEDRFSPVPGLVHRYPDRCLLLLTNLCFTYCRHCLRKRIWKEQAWRYRRRRFLAMRDYLAATPSVREVVLSGGDPLTLPNTELGFIFSTLRAIPHLEVIRIHTRAPVVLPSRIEAGLLKLMDQAGPVWLNTQFNHPREITLAAAAAVDKLLRAGVPVGNQAVLLRGVNDDLETQRSLHLGLLRIKVRPYYLFHCDPAEGVGHFRTSIATGRAILEAMGRTSSGLAIPAYARELPEGGGKKRIA
jgi:lysine 2,3-aminomutase